MTQKYKLSQILRKVHNFSLTYSKKCPLVYLIVGNLAKKIRSAKRSNIFSCSS